MGKSGSQRDIPDSQTSSYRDLLVLINNSQGAWVLFGERGQEDVGKVDEKSTDGLLGCVEKPGKDQQYELDFFILSCCMSKKCLSKQDTTRWHSQIRQQDNIGEEFYN